MLVDHRLPCVVIAVVLVTTQLNESLVINFNGEKRKERFYFVCCSSVSAVGREVDLLEQNPMNRRSYHQFESFLSMELRPSSMKQRPLLLLWDLTLREDQQYCCYCCSNYQQTRMPLLTSKSSKGRNDLKNKDEHQY